MHSTVEAAGKTRHGCEASYEAPLPSLAKVIGAVPWFQLSFKSRGKFSLGHCAVPDQAQQKTPAAWFVGTGSDMKRSSGLLGALC